MCSGRDIFFQRTFLMIPQLAITELTVAEFKLLVEIRYGELFVC